MSLELDEALDSSISLCSSDDDATLQSEGWEEESGAESDDPLQLAEREWVIIEPLYRLQPTAPAHSPAAAAAAAPAPAAASCVPPPGPSLPRPLTSAVSTTGAAVWKGVSKLWAPSVLVVTPPPCSPPGRPEAAPPSLSASPSSTGRVGKEGGARWVWVDETGAEREFEDTAQEALQRAYMNGKLSCFLSRDGAGEGVSGPRIVYFTSSSSHTGRDVSEACGWLDEEGLDGVKVRHRVSRHARPLHTPHTALRLAHKVQSTVSKSVTALQTLDGRAWSDLAVGAFRASGRAFLQRAPTKRQVSKAAKHTLRIAATLLRDAFDAIREAASHSESSKAMTSQWSVAQPQCQPRPMASPQLPHNKTKRLLPLSETSEDYERVHGLFRETVYQHMHIVCVETIKAGKDRRREYQRQHYDGTQAGNGREVVVFHGCSRDAALKIATKGRFVTHKSKHSSTTSGCPLGRTALTALGHGCRAEGPDSLYTMVVATLLLDHRDNANAPPEVTWSGTGRVSEDPGLLVLQDVSLSLPHYVITFKDQRPHTWMHHNSNNVQHT